jgi:hypothetical protein
MGQVGACRAREGREHDTQEVVIEAWRCGKGLGGCPTGSPWPLPLPLSYLGGYRVLPAGVLVLLWPAGEVRGDLHQGQG